MCARLVAAAILLSAVGCQNTLLRSQSPDPDPPVKPQEFKDKVDTKLLGEYMSVHGNAPVVLQGIGLVTGLDGTGGDPPPSVARTDLREEMSRHGVKNPERILKDPSTALVVVRAYLPPLARKGQELDIEVRLPPNTNATSLRGGWLMATRLTEQQATGKGVLKGQEYATARGPILLSGFDGENESKVAQVQRGMILAGGRSLTERDLTIVLRNDFRSVRNSKRISDAISKRFYHYNKYGNREALAKGVTDQQIELKLHPRYKNNDWRYKQVIRSIAFKESEVAARVRQQQLRADLMDPVKARSAALQLEAIGRESIPFLKKALTGPHLETRFHAAVALAYLGEAAGVDALVEAARDEPGYRSHAFAALSVTHDSDAQLALRELMNENSAETRYGAFRALSILDSNDLALQTERLPHGFNFHELDTKGDQMVHITHRRKPEVVLFGKDMKFKTPMVLGAGRHIMIRAVDDSGEVTISRFQVGEDDVREPMTASVADIIRKCVELGASYPDIAEMLMQARQQHNLPCRLEIDAVPKANTTFKRVGKSRMAKADPPPKPKTGSDSMQLASTPQIEPADDRGRASVVDMRDESEPEPTRKLADNRPTLRERFTRMFRRKKSN